MGLYMMDGMPSCRTWPAPATRRSSPKASFFPKAFGNAAQDSYMESQDTYTTLFEDQAKYNAIMHALGSIVYREMRGQARARG